MVYFSKLVIIHISRILVLIAIARMTHSFTTALLLGQHTKASSRFQNIPGNREGDRVFTNTESWLFLTAPQYEPSRIKCAMNGVGKDESVHQPKILQFISPYGRPSDKDTVDDELKMVNSDLMSVEKAVDSVNDQFSKLEADILAVEINCAELDKILKDTKDTLVEKQLDVLYRRLDKLTDKENKLIDQKNKLMDKENKLRDKENLLRTRKFKLTDEMQGPAGELLCSSAY